MEGFTRQTTFALHARSRHVGPHTYFLPYSLTPLAVVGVVINGAVQTAAMVAASPYI